MADIVLTTTVPEAYVKEVTDAFVAVGGASFRLEINKHNHVFEKNPASADCSMVISERDVEGGETLKDYSERMLRSLGLMVVRSYAKWLDTKQRYHPAIEAIERPKQNVDDGAII